MQKCYVNLQICDETEFLQEHYPNAFMLLCYIASKAREVSGKPDGLEIGEALIGDYKKAGIATRAKYRGALKLLLRRGHIEILETCRTRKPKTNGLTTVGTKVKITQSNVYDLSFRKARNEKQQKITTDLPTNIYQKTTILQIPNFVPLTMASKLD